jgi:hypothetical protein
MNDNVQERNAALKASEALYAAHKELVRWLSLGAVMNPKYTNQAACLRDELQEYAGFLETHYKGE